MTSNIPSLELILKQYGMEADHDTWANGWPEFETRYNPDLEMLEERYLDQQCRFLNLDTDVREAILAGRTLFDRKPLLRRLFWHTHYTGFKHDYPNLSAFQWPGVPDTIDPAAPLFYVYVFLSGLPSILDHNRRIGISDQVTVDTLRELQFWIRDEQRKKARWGLDYSQVYWLGLHFTGELYQLGRLQFQFSRYGYDYTAYRHRATGRVVLLAADGMVFRRDGHFNGVNGISDPGSWTASLTISDDRITGHPLHPNGYALSDQIVLPTGVWDHILKKDDPTIAVHILGSGPMDFEASKASYAEALQFWPRYFPDYTSHAFTCSSWLLDQQFENALRSESNIVRFLREWYLTPSNKASDKETIRRVFGIHNAGLEDIIHLPRTTSLQQAVVDHMERGGRWRSGAGVMFPHNFGWGDQVYRRDFEAITR